MPQGDILYLVDMEFQDGRKTTMPGIHLPPGQNLEALAERYLKASKRGVAFPGLAKAVARPATKEEHQLLYDRQAQARHHLKHLGLTIPEEGSH